MFIHFLLTRFNLKIPEWEKTRDNKPIDERWLEHRFNLFDNYCFPSVKNQSNKNFKWLVFFDIDTPKKYFDKIKSYSETFGNFIPLFTSNTLFKTKLSETINRFLNDEITHIITTRLDNDDAIHINFIDKIQSCFNYQDFCVVDIVNGYRYNIEKKPELAIKKNFSNNPFISLIELVGSYKTIYSRMHASWESEKQRIILNEKLWLQIIHVNNRANYMTFNVIYINDYSALRNFSISEKIMPKKNKSHIYILKNFINKLLYKKKRLIKKTKNSGKIKRILKNLRLVIHWNK
jgi:hypothetical protein